MIVCERATPFLHIYVDYIVFGSHTYTHTRFFSSKTSIAAIVRHPPIRDLPANLQIHRPHPPHRIYRAASLSSQHHTPNERRVAKFWQALGILYILTTRCVYSYVCECMQKLRRVTYGKKKSIHLRALTIRARASSLHTFGLYLYTWLCCCDGYLYIQ